MHSISAKLLPTIVCIGLIACGDGKGDTQSTATESSGTDASTGAPTTMTMVTNETTGTTTPEVTTGPTSTDSNMTTAPTTTSPSTTDELTGTSTTTTGEMTTTVEMTTTAGMTTEVGMPVEKPCGNMTYECGDTIDNDGDGAIDGGDKECTSPCDDSEGSLQTNLPGMAEDCKGDCFWDADSGNGQDKCEYDLTCDPLNPGAGVGCEFVKECPPVVGDVCLDVCTPLTPNGCDCFGCCHIDTGNGIKDIYLDSSPDCAIDNLEACASCTFQESCQNTCDVDKCELCFGDDELPDECGPDPTCDADDLPCTVSKEGVDNCPDGFFCQTGCCQQIIPK